MHFGALIFWPHAATAICGGTVKMTTNTADDFYSNIDGALTPEQAAQALALAEQGDTGTQPDNSGAPSTATAPTQQAPIAEDQLSADNAVVLAKDGKHTISYDKLVQAREGEKHWKAQAEAAQAQADEAARKLAELQAQAQSRAEAGQAATTTDNMAAQAQAAIESGVDVSLFGDFSEEALAAGIQMVVAAQVAAQMNKAIAPLTAKQLQDEAAAHYTAIYTAHPDANSIAESQEFAAWVNSHPSAVRNAYWQLFDPQQGGQATEIIEVFDAFKKASDAPTAQPTTSAKAAAQAVARAAQAMPPSSLSAIPGGRADGQTPNERLAGITDGRELYMALEGKTPEQLEAFLNQQM